MMSREIVLLLAFSLFTTGCAHLYEDYSVNDLSLDDESPYRNLSSQLKQSPSIVDAKCFNVPVRAADKAECGEQRNSAIAVLVLSSEKLCVDHRKTIYGNEATWNITSGTFANLFSGAAAVASVPESTKSILSALALFSNSERALVNETVYKTALIQAVDTKIVQKRRELAIRMYGNFRSSIDDYPLTLALHEIIEFHYACSFMDGLRLALEEGTQERAKQKVTRLKENLQTISNEMNSIPVGDRAARSKVQFDALADRYKSLAEELKSLEKQ